MNLLLRCLDRAVVRNAGGLLIRCLPFGEALYDIARDALDEWKSCRRSAVDRRSELETLAQADANAVRKAAQAVAADVASPDMREPLTEYLQRLPAVVRRSLSRPQDPSGHTAPAGLPLDQPEDLVPFLPARPPRFQPGDRPEGVNGWELQELLGVGGFGEVWLARDDKGRQAALKFCLDPSSARCLRNEKDLLSRIQNRNGGQTGLVHLLDSQARDRPALPGVRVHPRRRPDAIDPLLAWVASDTGPSRLGESSADGAPGGNRHLKPSNILLQPARENRVWIRMANFGIGAIASRHGMKLPTSLRATLTSGLRGAHTPHYASPEQKHGAPADLRDDVHALGVIWYQMLTGKVNREPGAGCRSTLEKLHTPQYIMELIVSCLSRADRRPANAAILADHIADASGHEAGEARPAGLS